MINEGQTANTASVPTNEQIFASLLGETVTRVALEQWSVRILFNSAELIIEAQWSLSGRHGKRHDHSQPLRERTSFSLWRIVGEDIESIQLSKEALRLPPIASSTMPSE